MDEWGYVVVVVAIAVLVSLREETLAGITKTVVVIACRMLFGVGDGVMVRNEEKSLIVITCRTHLSLVESQKFVSVLVVVSDSVGWCR